MKLYEDLNTHLDMYRPNSSMDNTFEKLLHIITSLTDSCTPVCTKSVVECSKITKLSDVTKVEMHHCIYHLYCIFFHHLLSSTFCVWICGAACIHLRLVSFFWHSEHRVIFKFNTWTQNEIYNFSSRNGKWLWSFTMITSAWITKSLF